MTQYSNAQILSAVLNKWLEPVISQFATTLTASKIQNIPFLANLENKLKTMGWFGANYSIANEIAPLAQPVVTSLAQPFLNKHISQLDDASIPMMAHKLVDNAIEQGSFSLFDGKVTFELSDLQDLKRLLKINLPITEDITGYVVKEMEEL